MKTEHKSMSIYRGLSDGGRCTVSVPAISSITGFKFLRQLSPAPSQKIRNHSPDGFNWGYSGSGPAQLALALLLDHTGNAAIAQQRYQQFKSDVIALMPPEWELSSEEIEMWLDGKAGKDYFNGKFHDATATNPSDL